MKKTSIWKSREFRTWEVFALMLVELILGLVLGIALTLQ